MDGKEAKRGPTPAPGEDQRSSHVLDCNPRVSRLASGTTVFLFEGKIIPVNEAAPVPIKFSSR